MADQMDVEIGRLVDAIDALGIRENTLILFTTDNGTAKRSIIRAENGGYIREPVVSTFHGKKIPGGKTQLTDWGTRVPLIANWKGVTAAGQVRDELVDFSDLLPTFAELTGGQLPEGVTLDGHSFAGLLTGRGTTDRRWAYAESRIARFFAKTQRWKLYNSGQLFDTENDPDEQHPISAGERSAEAESAYRLLSTAVRQLNARTSAAKP
jgi:arylsulfatase A-like enzyme